MIDNNIPTAIITVQGTAVVYDSSLWWADYLTITTEPDGVTVILDTDHNINLSVSSGHNVTAILKGDGNGNAVAEVYGQAIRQGNGNAISHGGGQSVRQGSGDGDAVSYGDGQTVRQGSGNGNATSHGGGQAVRQGSGDGDAVSYGDGEALKSGRGVGPSYSVATETKLN